jgi:hypothetical protein
MNLGFSRDLPHRALDHFEPDGMLEAQLIADPDPGTEECGRRKPFQQKARLP